MRQDRQADVTLLSGGGGSEEASAFGAKTASGWRLVVQPASHMSVPLHFSVVVL